jgi:3-oxoacyl-[acyl-carrier protein] reductase
VTRRVAVVTGGGRSIGRACALALARTGCMVAVHYARDEAAACNAVAAITAAGGEARAFRADLAQADELERFHHVAVAAFGPVEILVSNAGIAPTTSLDAITLDEWQTVLDTNLRATFLLSRLALPGMRARGWGRIVTIASQAGLTGGYFVGAHYAASKGALIALTKSLARLAADAGNVTANCVAPGLIDTDLTRGFPAERRAGLVAAIPMKRMGTADEVAAAVTFLASEAASYITGAVLPVDGALLAG